MIIFYLLMGTLFMYFAITSGQPVFSFWTLLPAAMATYDYAMAARLIKFRLDAKKKNDKKS